MRDSKQSLNWPQDGKRQICLTLKWVVLKPHLDSLDPPKEGEGREEFLIQKWNRALGCLAWQNFQWLCTCHSQAGISYLERDQEVTLQFLSPWPCWGHPTELPRSNGCSSICSSSFPEKKSDPHLLSGGREEPDGWTWARHTTLEEETGGERFHKPITGKTHNWKQMLIKIATFGDQTPLNHHISLI